MGVRPKQNPSRAVLSFLARFLGAWAIALALLATFPSVESWALRMTIESLSLLSSLFRLEFAATGTAVRLAGADLEIVSDCTSIMPTLALWAAILAFPVRGERKYVGVLLGGVALWLFNLLRVLGLALVLRFQPGWFGFVHAYLWQTLTLTVVLLSFLWWVRLFGRPSAAR